MPRADQSPDGMYAPGVSVQSRKAYIDEIDILRELSAPVTRENLLSLRHIIHAIIELNGGVYVQDPDA